MNWEAIGAVGEVLGAIGVIVTLAYLAVQIRQNSAMMRSSAVQSSNSRITGTAGLVANSESAAVLARGMRSLNQLDEGERTHFTSMISTLFITMDSTYWDHRMGFLPDEIWERELEMLRNWLVLPGVRDHLPGQVLSQPFADLVAAELEAIGRRSAPSLDTTDT